ncbi:MAG TPA: hypothetical protein VHP32_05705 [Ignavibacteria bacterium]|nr:hypothetical protein [Ignavibacteria bacterium]
MSKIVAIFRAPDMTREQYDTVIKKLEEAGKGKIKERPHHIMGLNNGGSIVIDVWESPEALNEFFGTLSPILEGTGVTAPQPEIYPVHNIIS